MLMHVILFAFTAALTVQLTIFTADVVAECDTESINWS